jgi:hypothetical protein
MMCERRDAQAYRASSSIASGVIAARWVPRGRPNRFGLPVGSTRATERSTPESAVSSGLRPHWATRPARGTREFTRQPQSRAGAGDTSFSLRPKSTCLRLAQLDVARARVRLESFPDEVVLLSAAMSGARSFVSVLQPHRSANVRVAWNRSKGSIFSRFSLVDFA